MAVMLELVILTVLAVVGALLTAVGGWADNGEPFDIRKFYPSILRAIGAGLLVVIGFQGVTVFTYFDFVLAFLGGMGIDAGGHVASKVVSKITSPTV